MKPIEKKISRAWLKIYETCETLAISVYGPALISYKKTYMLLNVWTSEVLLVGKMASFGGMSFVQIYELQLTIRVKLLSLSTQMELNFGVSFCVGLMYIWPIYLPLGLINKWTWPAVFVNCCDKSVFNALVYLICWSCDL